MDIRIRHNFLHPYLPDIAFLAMLISLASFFYTARSLGTYGPCPGVDTNGNSSNITLPSASSCWSAFWNTCLGWSTSSTGTESVELCILDKARCHAHFSTIIMFASQLEAVRLIFTVDGNDRRRFLCIIRLFPVLIFPLVLLPMLWYDCYHRLIVCVSPFTWSTLFVFMIRPSLRNLLSQRQQRPDQNRVEVTRH